MEEPVTPQTTPEEMNAGMNTGAGSKKPDRTVKIAIWALAGLIFIAVIFFALNVRFSGTPQAEPGSPQGETGEGTSTTTQVLNDPNSAENISKNYALLNYRNKALGLTIDQNIGTYFTEPSAGMTLYVMRDGGECTSSCLTNWTPYLASEKVSNDQLTTVVRSDSGKLQYAWHGKGLYTYKGDAKPGDVLGDGFDYTKWIIARPIMQ